jgi:hypothetical protein
MSRTDDGAWGLGRKAWERLTGWSRVSGRSHPDSGDAALRALDDISLVRRLLDQAELEAVRTARRYGRSWSEIATTLAVTRQSAWERWRDLDQSPEPEAVEERVDEVVEEIVEVIVNRDSVLDPAIRDLRRSSRTRVPNVVGMSSAQARDALDGVGLVAVSPDPDGPPLGFVHPGIVVTDQSPESGARVPTGTHVRLWTSSGRGGGAGVREPLRPKPEPPEGQAVADLTGERAVS